MKTLRLSLVIGFCFLLIVHAGCGYTTRAYTGPHKTIYVAPFANGIDIASAKSEYRNYLTYYPLLESTITQEVVDRFIFDGSLRVVKEDKAELVMKGELTAYDRGALRYAENNEDVTEFRVTIWVNVELRNNTSGELMWKKDIAGDSTYFTTGTQAKTEKTALDNAISDLARRVVAEIAEAW